MRCGGKRKRARNEDRLRRLETSNSVGCFTGVYWLDKYWGPRRTTPRPLPIACLPIEISECIQCQGGIVQRARGQECVSMLSLWKPRKRLGLLASVQRQIPSRLGTRTGPILRNKQPYLIYPPATEFATLFQPPCENG